MYREKRLWRKTEREEGEETKTLQYTKGDIYLPATSNVSSVIVNNDVIVRTQDDVSNQLMGRWRRVSVYIVVSDRS